MRFGLILGLLVCAAAPAASAPWVLDKGQAHVTFMIDNLGFSTTVGQFRAFDAVIDFDPESVETSAVAFTLQAASVDTNAPARDERLRGPEFLDAATFPELTFRSRKVRLTSAGVAEITGDMTIRDVTRQEVFTARLVRLAPSPFDRSTMLAGFEVEGALDRTDYGVSYGAPAIGEKVRFRIDLQIQPAP